MNLKYRNTPYYNRAINAIQNLNTSDKNKDLIANSIASLLERNKDLDIDENVIMERLGNLNEIIYEDYGSDSTIAGYCNHSHTLISIDDSINKESDWHQEVLIHELMHQISNVRDASRGIRGINGLPYHDFKYINEVITQINAYDICEDLGINSYKQYSVDIPGGAKCVYKTCGGGYNTINKVGEELLILDRKGFIEANFNPEKNLSLDYSLREKMKELNENLGLALDSISGEELAESLKKVDKTMHNITIHYMEKNDFEKYWDVSKKISRNDTYQSINLYEKKLIANLHYEERLIQDIAMYGIASGMDMDKINAEINSDNHSSKLIDFNKGCELLRRYNVDVTLEDIQKAEIKTVSLLNREYITVKLNDKTYQGVGVEKNGSYYIEPKRHYIPFGTYHNMAFSENDLTNETVSIKFDENLYFKSWINQDNPELRALYASYLGESVINGYQRIVYDGPITDFSNIDNLIKDGKLEKLLDNVEINSLKDYFLSKNDSGKMKIEEILENENSWKGGIKAICEICRSNYFTELPCSIDYERLSERYGENVLVEIYKNDRRMLDLMIEKGADLNYTYNDDNIINNFVQRRNVQYTYDIKDYLELRPKEHIGNTYEYFVNNGIDLNTMVKDSHYFEKPIWEQILLGEFNENSKKMLENLKSEIKIEEINPGSVVSDIFYKSYFDTVEKLNFLTDLGIDIEKVRGPLSLNAYEYVAADYINCQNPDKKEFMMEILKHDFDFSRNLKEEVDTIGGYSLYYPIENPPFFGYGLITSGHLLLKTGDADLIIEAIESPETKISFKDVFNSRTPSEYLDLFSEEDKAKFKELEARLQLQETTEAKEPEARLEVQATSEAADKLPDLPLGREDIAADILPSLPTEGRDVIHFVSNEDLPDLPIEIDTSSRDTEDKIEIEIEEYELS